MISSSSTGPKRQTVVVFGAGPNQIRVVAAAHRLGFGVVAIDRNPNALAAPEADEFICASLDDYETIERALGERIFSAVVARITSSDALECAQRFAASRGLAAPCPALLKISTSKRALTRFCQRLGIPVAPRVDPEHLPDLSLHPVIVRPDITIQGKAGIRRVSARSELAAASQMAADCSANGLVEISTWIAGQDLSALVHFDCGRATCLAAWDEWVAITPTGEIRGLGTGMPSSFESALALLAPLADQLARALPNSTGLVTLSVRVDENGFPIIVEIHLGIGGDGIADQLLPSALPGFDPFALLIRASTRQPIAVASSPPKPRGLLRQRNSWKLIEASNTKALHRAAAHGLPLDWEAPSSLRGPGDPPTSSIDAAASQHA